MKKLLNAIIRILIWMGSAVIVLIIIAIAASKYREGESVVLGAIDVISILIFPTLSAIFLPRIFIGNSNKNSNRIVIPNSRFSDTDSDIEEGIPSDRQHNKLKVKEKSYLDIVCEMETDFEKTYRFAYDRMLNSADCQKSFQMLCNRWGGEDQPLPVQIRFEQLRDIYSPRFENPNPMLAVDSMTGYEFENWCAELLKKIGFVNVSMTPGSGDQGVDILAERSGITYAIQCKCYSSDLGNGPVQEILAGRTIYKRHLGVVMKNRYFTQGAKDAAAATGVVLWNRDDLQRMVQEAQGQ